MLRAYTVEFEVEEGKPRCLHCPMLGGRYDDIMQLWQYYCRAQNIKNEYTVLESMQLKCKLVERSNHWYAARKRREDAK